MCRRALWWLRMCREAGEQHRRLSSSGSEAGASSPWKILAVAALVLKWELREHGVGLVPRGRHGERGKTQPRGEG